VITFLPNIIDSSIAERESYLDRVKEIGLKFRGKPYKFLWAQGGDHFDFEDKLGAIGVGYPVVVVIYETKKVFGKLRKSFSE
jgi:protein disulfide-isomerase A6